VKEPQVAQGKDPLADLREPDPLDPATPAGLAAQVRVAAALEAAKEEVAEVRTMVTQTTWDAMVSEAVAHLHADLTAQGFLHGGAACGCHYIARTVLRVVPVMTDADMEERELVPSD
jgi:hypothetical protein